jgi:hypothetical protein
MAVQLELSSPHESACALRSGVDRRRGDRRAAPRETPDRRRGDRRRGAMRNMVFTALAVVAPLHPLPSAHPRIETPPVEARLVLQPRVTTSIDRVEIVPPSKAYDGLIQEAAVVHNLDPRLIRSVMQTESAFNPVAVSPAGALGLMQLMPAVAAELNVSDPFDPRENIMAGAAYLRWLLDLYNGNLRLTLASYNAGLTNVARYGGVPPFEETRNYVVRVTRLLRGG